MTTYSRVGGRLASAAMLLTLATGLAFAQNDGTQPAAEAAPEPAPFVAPTYAPAWSDAMIAEAANALVGTWTSSGPVAQMTGDGSAAMVMTVAAAPVQGLSDTLYVEAARADALYAPFRHAIFQLIKTPSGVRLRTYEMRFDAARRSAFTGLWAQPGYFPTITKDDLIATIDVDLAKFGVGSFSGKAPHPYPTGIGGAMEMMSALDITPTSLTTRDQGMDAAGKVVWGQQPVTFSKSDPKAKVIAREDGMVIVEYANPGDAAVADGDMLHIHYTGYLSDGSIFDSSVRRNQPFVFNFPPGTRAITGWGIGMEGITIGARRKLIIPGYLAYGERGNPRANIPPDATLFFDIHCVHMDKPEPDPAGETSGEGAAPTGGSTQPGHEGHNHD